MECSFWLVWVVLVVCLWTAGSTRNANAWKIVPPCLLLCLLREINDMNFEDRERMVEGLSLFSSILFILSLFPLWSSVIMIFLFFVLSPSTWLGVFSYIFPMYLEVSYAFYDNSIIYIYILCEIKM